MKEEEFFDPEDLSISVFEVASQIAEKLEIEVSENSPEFKALEFGVCALDIFMSNKDKEFVEPFSIIEEFAELYFGFK